MDIIFKPIFIGVAFFIPAEILYLYLNNKHEKETNIIILVCSGIGLFFHFLIWPSICYHIFSTPHDMLLGYYMSVLLFAIPLALEVMPLWFLSLVGLAIYKRRK